MRNLTVGKRLALGFGIVIVLMAIVGTVSVVQLSGQPHAAAVAAAQAQPGAVSGAENAGRGDDNASARLVVIATSLLGILGAIVSAALITRSVLRELGCEPAYAAGIAREIAAGNLAVDVDLKPGDDQSLLAAIRTMRDSLAVIVRQVRQSSDSIATGSQQIAAGNQELSGRTEHQASSLQQTAASMEQLTATVKQSADSAKQASQLAVSASTAASKGGVVVGQVVSTMEEISAASRKIAEIINVIDGIAFQTNILALNAAVEAARAGDQGRGFAVVAGEVRNLAQRSAQAAREIKAMISDSVEKVGAGSKLVNDAGASMNEIVAQVTRVTDLIAEITSAALEQSSGIGQVNESVTHMDQGTQQNAALVEQSAAAAASLKDQADQLARAVAVFKLSAAESRQVIATAQLVARVAAPAPSSTPMARPALPPGKPATRKPAAYKPGSPPAHMPERRAPLNRPQPGAKPPAPPDKPAAGDSWEEF